MDDFSSINSDLCFLWEKYTCLADWSLWRTLSSNFPSWNSKLLMFSTGKFTETKLCITICRKSRKTLLEMCQDGNNLYERLETSYVCNVLYIKITSYLSSLLLIVLDFATRSRHSYRSFSWRGRSKITDRLGCFEVAFFVCIRVDRSLVQFPTEVDFSDNSRSLSSLERFLGGFELTPLRL